jgi:uncharacterized protein (DUF1501 family)
MMNRREFIKAVTLASTAPLWIRINAIAADASSGSAPAPAAATPDHLLLVLYLAGGNDGLNTIVPYLDGAYKSLRPQIALKASELYGLGDGLGLPRDMPRLYGMWKAGRVAVVHNVGYPNPSFSHFDSTYVWETGSPSQQFHTGWLGRYLDHTDAPGNGPVRAVAVGTDGLPRTLIGEHGNGVELDRLSDFGFVDNARGDAALRRAAFVSFGAGMTSDGSMRSRVLAAQDRMVRAVASVSQAANKHKIDNPTPAQTVAQMFAAGLGTQVAFVMVDGFDTHTEQRTAQAMRLAVVDDTIGSFFDTATSLGLADRATILTFSDFGRRAGENGSRGTDHGSSMPVFAIGPKVRGGFYGTRPDLTKLADGNLIPAIHFGSVYASVLSQALGVNPDPILGGSFPTLPLFG